MRNLFSASVVGMTGILMGNIALAHPGHAPTDVAAQVSQPLAGVDHLVAFVLLTSVLLVGLRFASKLRNGSKAKTRS
jgi:hypothetical protein